VACGTENTEGDSMSYNDLSQSTLGPDERREEALRIITMLDDYQDELRSHEYDMIARVRDGAPVSVKMLFWLRDIKDRILA
jgi:hypothetical protein